ncbi:MAG: uracil-DNA glycosylase [Cellulosilyticaceae bacterium]
MINIGNSWDTLLQEEFSKPYYLKIREFLKSEYQTHTIYPDMYDIFNALKLTPYEAVRVVILGQDPYHQPGQAHGLSFSVKPGVSTPPSLLNIYKELQSDLGCTIPNNGYLLPWAKQGVLLLNTVLTVRASSPNSHKDIGWEILTDRIITSLNDSASPIVFLLWGKNAISKKALITSPKHLILTAPHPSPLSAHRGFLGCHHFSKTNEFLRTFSEPINWQIPNL